MPDPDDPDPTASPGPDPDRDAFTADQLRLTDAALAWASYPATAGISLPVGGGGGLAAHRSSAATTSAGAWYRSAGRLASIFASTADSSRGTSGRSSWTGTTGRIWWAISFWATFCSTNGGLPVSRKYQVAPRL